MPVLAEKVSSAGAEPEKLVRQPPSVRKLTVLATLHVTALMTAMPMLPFIWTDSEEANGDAVRGGTLHSFSMLLNALGELATVSLIGSLSDCYGRKPFLILSGIGLGLTCTVGGLACRDKDYALAIDNGHIWLMVALTNTGLCGNALVICRAYVADATPPEDRAQGFAMVFSAIGMSYILGPTIGLTLSRISLQLPMFFAAGLCWANTCLMCTLTESLAVENRQPRLYWQRANPLGPLLFFMSSKFLIIFGFMMFLDNFSIAMVQVAFIPFVSVTWDTGPALTSLFIVVMGLLTILVLVFVLKPFVDRYGELTATKVGYALTGSSFFVIAMASYGSSPLYLVPALFIAALGNISAPSEQAIGSRCVAASDQGRLQAAGGALDIVGKLTGSALVYAVWEPTARVGNYGAVWWVASAVVVPGVFAAFLLERVLPEDVKRAVRGKKQPPDEIAETKLRDVEIHTMDKLDGPSCCVAAVVLDVGLSKSTFETCAGGNGTLAATAKTPSPRPFAEDRAAFESFDLDGRADEKVCTEPVANDSLRQLAAGKVEAEQPPELPEFVGRCGRAKMEPHELRAKSAGCLGFFAPTCMDLELKAACW